jgi:V/A-type H+-transporting ATPase subunit B
MSFGRAFEEKFLTQRTKEFRSIEESLNLSWQVLSILPVSELDRLDNNIIDKHYEKK